MGEKCERGWGSPKEGISVRKKCPIVVSKLLDLIPLPTNFLTTTTITSPYTLSFRGIIQPHHANGQG
jgi:hypothetical protein